MSNMTLAFHSIQKHSYFKIRKFSWIQENVEKIELKYSILAKYDYIFEIKTYFLFKEDILQKIMISQFQNFNLCEEFKFTPDFTTLFVSQICYQPIFSHQSS